MLCLSAETEAVRRDTPMCEERQTHSDRTLPGLTNPIRSTMRETATSSLSLKHRLTFCPLSAFIRTTVRHLYGARIARSITIQYGGSMKPANAAELLAQPDIDGGLIGGASLNPEDFIAIINAANQG